MSSILNSPFSSPSSSPSLGPVDSSPPSSPNLVPLAGSPTSPGPSHPFAGSTKAVKPLPLYEKRGTKRPRAPAQWEAQVDSDVEFGDVFVDETPPRRVDRSSADWNPDVRAHAQTLVLAHPFAASAKGDWMPPAHEKKMKTHSRSTSDASTITDIFAPAFSSTLQDAFVYRPLPTTSLFGNHEDSEESDMVLGSSPVARRTRRVSMSTEQRRWDEAINNAISEANGLIDLSASGVLGTVLTYIPPSIGDLANLVLLESDNNKQIVKPIPTRSGTPEPDASGAPRKRFFARSLTVPARQPGQSIFDYSPRKQVSKSKSSVHVPLVVSAEHDREITEVQLLLMGNTISRLPIELFSVISLTVLNLRGNTLTSMPPQIAHLVNLRELNVKNNNLKYLPSDMLGMKLRVLELDLNPWLTPEDLNTLPDGPRQLTSCPQPTLPWQQRQEERMVSDTKIHLVTLSLTEYCLRVLLSPHQPKSPPSEPAFVPSGPSTSATILDFQMDVQVQDPPWPRYMTNLEAYHELPLSSHDGHPPHVLDALRACLPDSVARPDTRTHVQGHAISPGNRARQTRPISVQEEIFSFTMPDVGQALQPHPYPHPSIAPLRPTAEMESGNEEQPDVIVYAGVGVCPSPKHNPRNSRVFIKHAEERFTWENVIADVPAGVRGGIPVLWRGCSQGCLRFLDPPEKPEEETNAECAKAQSGAVECTEGMDIDFDMADSRSENGFGVEVMDLSGGLDEFI